MKDKLQSNRPQKKVSQKSSTSNLFLNFIIIVLGIVIIFMAYSLFNKISFKGEDSVGNSKNNAKTILQVEVLNGCGVSGIADKLTDFLRKNNFDVVQVGNFSSFDMDKSLVIDRTGNRSNAEKVANALGINKKNIVQQINNDYFLDCSVVIGKDYFQLKPFN